MSPAADKCDVILRVDGDGDALRVRIESEGGRDSAPFELSQALWRDFTGESVSPEGSRARAGERVLVPVHRSQPASTGALGEALFRALFPSPVRNCFERSRARRARLRLCLEWDLDDPRVLPLQRLPWELLREPGAEVPMVLDGRTSLVRHLDHPGQQQPLPSPKALRILPLAANPRDLTRLDLASEYQALIALANEEPALDMLDTADAGPIDLYALRRQLSDRGAHILHFMGHGELKPNGDGCLFFERTDGRALAISGEALARSAGTLSGLRLVVLNACRSAEIRSRPFAGVATALVRAGVPAVLAMQAPISDRAAIAFARAFYSRLARGESLDTAVCEGRHAIDALGSGSNEWALPVLFARPGGEQLFDPGFANRGDGSQVFPGVDTRELEHRYLSWLREQTHELDLVGLRDAGPCPRLELEAIYGLLQQDRNPRAERPRSLSILRQETQRLENFFAARGLAPEDEHLFLWQELRRLARGGEGVSETPRAEPGGEPVSPTGALCSWDEVFRSHRRIVLLGDAGSGKTSLLRWLTFRIAVARLRGEDRLKVPARTVDPRRGDDEPIDLGPLRVPILLDATCYAQCRRKQPGLRLVEYLGRHLGPSLDRAVSDARGRRIDPESLHHLLYRELTQDRALLLIDGLDTLESSSEQSEILREIEICLDTFLPPPSPPPGTAGGNQVVLVSRPAAYHQAALDWPTDPFELEPLERQGLEQLCQWWARALPDLDGRQLFEDVERLRDRGATPHPLFVTTLAIVFAYHGRPCRRLDLYGPAVTVLIGRWREAHVELAANAELGNLEVLLAELAVELQERSEDFGLVARSWLGPWLEQHLRVSDPAMIDRFLSRDLGPLVAYGGGLHGFLYRALQEYLAACWLASSPEVAGQRLSSRLEDPNWRVPIALALGMLADRLEPEATGSLVEQLFATASRQTTGEPGTAAVLLALDLLPELPQDPSLHPLVIRLVRWTVSRAVEGGALGELVEHTLAACLAGPKGEVVARALAAILFEPGEKLLETRTRIALCLARIAYRVPEIPPALVDPLAELRFLDRPPWPIERFLRRLASENPALLVAPRSSLRRILAREEKLSEHIRQTPAWRRLLLVIYGGSSDGPPAYRLSALDSLFLEAIRSRCSPQTLVSELSKRAAGSSNEGAVGDARIALVALGEGGRLERQSDRETTRRALDRSLVGLPTSRNVLPDALFQLVALLPATRRAGLLGWLWRFLLEPSDTPREIDPRHRLAVLLDTRGAFLCEPLEIFLESWIVYGGEVPSSASLEDRTATALDALARIPASFEFVRAWALVVLRPFLEATDLLGEAIVLAEISLSDRFSARPLAREKLLGRPAGPLSNQELYGRALRISDPWRRFRALHWLELGIADLRSELRIHRLASKEIYWSPLQAAVTEIGNPRRRALASMLLAGTTISHPRSREESESQARIGQPGAIAEIVRLVDTEALRPALDAPLFELLAREATGELPPAPVATPALGRPSLDVRTLDDLVEQLASPDEPTRHLAALRLHGNRSSLRHRWSTRQLGREVVLRLAHHWIRRREQDPRGALVLRWAFEILEHDSSELLQDLAELQAIPGPAADSAEVVFRHLEEVAAETAPTVDSILHYGPERAKRALVEGLPNVLARGGRRAETLWVAIRDSLPRVAAVFGNEHVVLAGAEAVVAAAETAWAESGHNDAQAVERAREIYASNRLSWCDLLLRESERLRSALEALGRRRHPGQEDRALIDVAAERVVDQPGLLALLVSWLDGRLWRDVQRSKPDEHTTSDLLELIAAAAHRLPRTYFEATSERPHWRRSLREVVELSDWLPARRAAVELLSLGRCLGPHELAALSAALGDGPEVQRTALESLPRYRRLEYQGALSPLEAELESCSSTRVFAAGRLLAAIARLTPGGTELRQRIEQCLAEAAARPDLRRPVHIASFDPSPASRSAGFVEIGRLDKLLQGFVLEIHNPPRPHIASANKE